MSVKTYLYHDPASCEPTVFIQCTPSNVGMAAAVVTSTSIVSPNTVNKLAPNGKTPIVVTLDAGTAVGDLIILRLAEGVAPIKIQDTASPAAILMDIPAPISLTTLTYRWNGSAWIQQ